MKNLNKFAILLSVGLAVAACASGPASSGVENVEKVTGMYSDMRYNEEGGDVLGTEVFVMRAQGGYYVVYQSSEGDPSVPVVIPAEVSGKTIKFDVPASSDPRGSFTGHVNAGNLAGTFSASEESVVLKRRQSYWQ